MKFKKPVNFNKSIQYNPDHPVSIYFMREFEKEGVLLSAANSELPYILATASHFSDEIKKDIIFMGRKGIDESKLGFTIVPLQ